MVRLILYKGIVGGASHRNSFLLYLIIFTLHNIGSTKMTLCMLGNVIDLYFMQWFVDLLHPIPFTVFFSFPSFRAAFFLRHKSPIAKSWKRWKYRANLPVSQLHINTYTYARVRDKPRRYPRKNMTEFISESYTVDETFDSLSWLNQSIWILPHRSKFLFKPKKNIHAL